MNRKDLVLAIDIGTQSTRAALVDTEGNIRYLEKSIFKPYDIPAPGLVEQDADYFWDELCSVTRRVLDAATRDGWGMISGVSLTTQRNTVVIVDEKGNPLRPAIVWMDERKVETGIIPSFLKPLLGIMGISGILESAAADCEARWIASNEPELWTETHKLLYISGYLNYRLTGEFIDSTGNIFGYVPFDVKRRTWASDRDLKWKLFGISRKQLPKLIETTGILGTVTKQASLETGIPSGTPVIAAASDKACEILGSGAILPSQACLSMGTMATVDIPDKEYIELKPFYPPFPSAVPGEYYNEFGIMRGFWMVTWFLNQFCAKEIQEAASIGKKPETLMDEHAATIPPGSEGLIVLPGWSPGPRDNPWMRGEITGFQSGHTKYHLYRAILEGLIFAMKKGAMQIEKKHKKTVDVVHVTGGGANSDLIMQMTADIFGLKAVRMQTTENSLIGTAIDTFTGLNYYENCTDAVNKMVRIESEFNPDNENHELYESIFRKVFKRLEPAVSPIHKEIQLIRSR